MELKLLNEQGQAASNVAAPDTIFGRDYNEALIHRSWLLTRLTRVAVTASKKIVKKCITRPRSHGVKKVRAVLVPVCRLRRCGVEVVGFSRTRQKRISLTKSTR